MNRNIVLRLADVLEITWVWQCEVKPKIPMLVGPPRKRFAALRRPEMHLPAYRKLLDDLFINLPEHLYAETKGAATILCHTSGIMFMFEKPFDISEFDEEFIAEHEPLGRYLIDAKVMLKPPSEKRKKAARELIRRLFQVDEYAHPLYRCENFRQTQRGILEFVQNVDNAQE